MSSKQNPKDNPDPPKILPGQDYMAIFSKTRWPELYHWLSGRLTCPSSQIRQELSTQTSSQLRETSPHQVSARNDDSTQPQQRSQTIPCNSGNENPVEDEYLRLNEELTPSTPNAEPESSHPVRQRRKVAEEDPWTASLEKAGGIDHYGSLSSASDPLRRRHSPASSDVSIYHDAEEQPSQKQQSGPRSAHGPAKADAKRSNEASGPSARQSMLNEAHNGESDDFVFLTKN